MVDIKKEWDKHKGSKNIIEICKEVLRKTPNSTEFFIVEYNEKTDLYRPKIINDKEEKLGEWEEKGKESSLGVFGLKQGVDVINLDSDFYDEGKLNVKIEKCIREFCIKNHHKVKPRIKETIENIRSGKTTPREYPKTQVQKWAEEKKDKKPEKKESKNTQTEFLLSQEKPVFKSLGIGILNGTFYFGTKVYYGTKGMDALVMDTGQVAVDKGETNEIKTWGLNYRFPFFDSILDYTWSNNSSEFSILNFHKGKCKQVKLKECYEDTYNNQIENIEHPSNIVHVSIACDINSSYYLPIFVAKGRSFFVAEFRSGKTEQAMQYDLQMFNSLMSADITGAAFFRACESTSCSIIVDDFDAIEDEKKTPLIQLLRTGYKQGQKAVRTGEGKTRTPEAFSIYNSMVLNNTGGLDDISIDRCNQYQMIRSTNKKITNKKLKVSDPKWLVQRDKKFVCALQNWKQVQEVYESLEVEGIADRDLERVAPILTIAKIVLSPGDFTKLVEYEIEKIKEQKNRDVSEDWLFMAMRQIYQDFKVMDIKDRKNGYDKQLNILVKEIMPFDENDRDYKKKARGISIWLGKIFKNTPLFKSGKIHGGFVKYTIKPDNFLKFLQIRDYIDFFDEVELKQVFPNLSNQPNQSILSNQSNQSIPNNNNNNKKEDIIQSQRESGEIGEIGEDIKGCKPILSEEKNKEILEEFYNE